MTQIEQIKAEIKRRRKAFIEKNDKIERGEIYQDEEDDFNRMLARYGNRVISQELFELLCFIESLEKEQDVDLDKEIDIAFFKHYQGTEKLTHKELSQVARHFYEFGCRQKDNAPKIKGWVARDKANNSDSLALFIGKKPTRYEEGGWWAQEGDSFMILPKDLFPEIKWKNNPKAVEVIIH